MKVELPNGVVLEGVPEGTTKDEIMAKAIAGGYATEQDFAPADPAEQDVPYLQQVQNRYQEFNPSQILSKVPEEYKRISDTIRQGRPGAAEQMAQGVVPAPLDPATAAVVGISQGARAGGEIIGGSIGLLIPDAVREGAQGAWDFIKEASYVKAATQALSKGGEYYEQWKQQNPAEAEQLEATLDVALLATPQLKATTAVADGVTKKARAAKREFNENNIEELRAGILRMMRPENFEGVGEVVEVGPTRKKVYVPNDKEDTVNKVLETVEDINPDRSYTYNHQVASTAIKEAEVDLQKHIKGSGNPKFDIDTVLGDMVSMVEDFSNTPAYKLLSADAQSKAKEFSSIALDMLRKTDGTATSLLEVRREFDKFLNAGSGNVFDPIVESAKSAAGQHVRNILNQQLKDITDGDEVHHLLDRQHNLYIAKDRLREGRAREGNNMFARTWETLKKRAMLPGTALSLVATGGALGKVLTESVLMGAGSGALLFTAGLGLRKKNRLRFYASTLSAMDKAIGMYADDQNLVNQLKADRMLLVDLIDETRQEKEE